MKSQRWYEIENNQLCVYNHPIKKLATGVSITQLSDINYYRRTFLLRKVWS